MKNDTQIIGSGAKRMRHGYYSCVYLCSRGRAKTKRYWRAEFQGINAGGAFRLRKWFHTREDGERWLGGIVNSQRLQDMGIASKY